MMRRPSWVELRAELAALAERFDRATEGTTAVDGDAGVARGVASALVILADVATFATTRLEVRALVHAAMGTLLEGELAARVEARRRTARSSQTKT